MSKINFKRILLLALPAFTLAMAPLTFDGKTVQVAEVCADGTCCRELLSICNIGGGDNHDYYKKACDGSCSQACQDT